MGAVCDAQASIWVDSLKQLVNLNKCHPTDVLNATAVGCPHLHWWNC